MRNWCVWYVLPPCIWLAFGLHPLLNLALLDAGLIGFRFLLKGFLISIDLRWTCQVGLCLVAWPDFHSVGVTIIRPWNHEKCLHRCSDWTEFASLAIVYDSLGVEASYFGNEMQLWQLCNLIYLASWGSRNNLLTVGHESKSEWPHWPTFPNMVTTSSQHHLKLGLGYDTRGRWYSWHSGLPQFTSLEWPSAYLKRASSESHI